MKKSLLTPVALAVAAVCLSAQAFAQTYELRQPRKGLVVQETPLLSLSTSAIAFTDQAVGTTSSAATLGVVNSRNSPATILGVSTTGPFNASTSCNGVVPANGTCPVSLTFAPTEVNSVAGSVTVSTNVGDYTATLTGTGTAGSPVWTVTAVSGTSFNSQFVPANSVQSRTLTVANTGVGQAFSLPALALMGDAAADYTATSNCQNIAPGQSCTVTVSFDAQGTGTRTASLTLGSTTTDFTGSGYDFDLSTTTLAFPDTAVNATSAGLTVQVTNPYSVTVPLSAPTAASPYTATTNCTSSLAPNASCQVTVTFRPTALQAYPRTLTIPTTGGSKTVNLTGTGVDGVPVWTVTANSGTSFAAQDVASTTPETRTITLRNTGTGVAKPLPTPSVTGAAAGDYSVTHNCTSVAVNGTCTVTVSFDAQAAGTRNATVNVGGNALDYAGFGFSSVGSEFNFVGSIQQYTVPETGTYTFEVIGAQGGTNTGGGYSVTPGGRGAEVRCTVSLQAGQVLKMLVGGTGGAANTYSGGGGGSFVTLLDNTPLCIAGGGGGGNYLSSPAPQPGQGFSGNGNGGTVTTGSGMAGGGGGLLTAGTNGATSGGAAFINGGAGGAAGSGIVAGGFGGGSAGGAGWWAGGSGGGYSGGIGARTGSGGTSFSAGEGSYTVTARTGNGRIRVLR